VKASLCSSIAAVTGPSATDARGRALWFIPRGRRLPVETYSPGHSIVASDARLACDGRLPGLSVFLPCHNEAANLERVVRGFFEQLPRFADRFEVIIVDDGSGDATGEIADRLAASDSRVKVVHHPLNRGYGGAVISGVRAATLPFVLLADGDGQFDPSDIGRLAVLAATHDLVVGRRTLRADNLVRRLNGRAWTTLVRLLFGLKIHDVDCGFKLFRRVLLDGLVLRANGAMISTELMARLAARGARICEVEVKHLPRLAGEQSGANLKVIAKAFAELFTLYRELNSKRSSAPEK
jgi:glycosyltransferase involved in cell wall biosynthesis